MSAGLEVVEAAIRRNEAALFDASFAKHRHSKRVPPEVTIQREILTLVDTALSNLALVFADPELARATGFDRVLAGDLHAALMAVRAAQGRDARTVGYRPNAKRKDAP
jgi:hypothetical protein